MPNNYNFSDLTFVKEIIINPIGWISNIVIEYGVGDYPEASYFWRVKGTTHTFIIPIKRLNFITLGNYEKHFEEALELFREDYIIWSKTGFNIKWQAEYFEQYKYFIIL